MNAFNTVNLAAASILTTTDFARELGVPESRWIYPLGGAGAEDSSDCTSIQIFIREELISLVWERPNFYSSPAISKSLDGALMKSGLRRDDIDLFDFYSYASTCSEPWNV